MGMWVDRRHVIAHNKVIIVDGITVCTGSFNFSTAAEYVNAENVVILYDKVLAQKYADNWQLHRGHSEAWKEP